MTLWLLAPAEDRPTDPWKPWYDKAFGFVVRAETEDEARALAQADAGDETHGGFDSDGKVVWLEPWLDPTLASCVPLTVTGDAEVVLRDHRGA